MRQTIDRENDPPPGTSIATLAHDYPRGAQVAPHAHGSDQLIYASRGFMEVSAGRRVWMIPPHFGLWIPARTVHEIRMPDSVSMRTLYLRSGLAALAPQCAVLHVSALLRELVVEIVRIGSLRARNRHECLLRDLLVAQLHSASPVPVSIELPQDPRALKIAQTVLHAPDLRDTLASLCADAGVSVRTLQRAFRQDVGMDFESWRRQVRLMKAVELLISGRSVKAVSYAVGYRQSTTFVQLFKETFGTTPKSWVSTLRQLR
jgi:AraC-like DNA-binding protein